MCVTYHPGPLGWGITKDGKPAGRINKVPAGRQYQVSLAGEAKTGRPFQGANVFATLSAAKAAVESRLGCCSRGAA